MNVIRVSNAEILRALQACGANKSRAAVCLGISRRQVQRRLHEMQGKKSILKHRSISVPIDWYWWLRKTMAALDMPTMEATTVKIFTEWQDGR